ncbi:uncharacterized protein LOC134455799 [Engraulis encrasicolus]|uniref:uncharacterized protein LOC134455799 n=1 Tax=Engraulis encrasicolus TaxID=184585 RepID=UPI002FD12F4E
METIEQLDTGTLTGYNEQEPQETELPENERTGNMDDDDDCYEEFLESMGHKVVVDILADLPPGMTTPPELDDIPCPKEALILEATPEELLHNESLLTSTVSDFPSSAESVCENEFRALRAEEPVVEDASEETLPDVLNMEEPEDVPEDLMEALNSMPTHDGLDEPPVDEVEESMLEQFIREEALSEVSTESCHDPEELDECLRVEIAVASSDSETSDNEKWRSIFSSSINKEDDDSYLDSLQLSAQELFIQKSSLDEEEEQSPKGYDNQENEQENKQENETTAVPLEAEILEQPEMDSEFEKREVTYTTPTLFHGLSKISEDDEENGKMLNNNGKNPDGSKKVPKDYCVIQEMKSENVSTEHVDFRVARKQWLEMEEQTKMAGNNTVQSPTTPKAPGHCQGGHSFMYTPVRNIDRCRRDPDFENLALGGDYAHTQFSPCSEDSGLDDLSYRSPYDDPETPVEREIRLTMEREESFRRERALSSSSSCEFTKIHPTKLCQEVDEKRRMFDHQDDGCSIPRSMTTPSFIITSSPVKGTQKREIAANNVIILEPDSSRALGSDLSAANSGNWNAKQSSSSSNVIILETSNLIIRSASEFCLNSAGEEKQESTFLNNPFFKLRSRSTQSLIDDEIKMVKQREEELRRQRAGMYTKEKFNTIVVAAPNLLNSASFESDMPIKCKSSPSSPMKTAYKMDRSIVSCDTRFPDTYAGGRRKSAMALRWENGEFANNN